MNNVRAFLALCNLINIDTMKKIILLSICLTVSLIVSAVEVTTTFSAQSFDGKMYLLDSVKIENLTRNWSKTIDCSVEESISYEVNETLPTGIDNIWTSSKEGGLISDYKNLIYGHSFSINVSQPGQVSLNVYDMLGRSMVSSTEYCSEGSHQYTLSLSQTQPFILSVRTANESAAIMLINMTNSGSNSITNENTLPVLRAPLRTHAEETVYVGDQMNYIGYSHRQGAVITSQTITITQGLSDETITFIFESASYSSEGAYVGIIGFNSQIYAYPIGILNNSNIANYNSFVNNLTTANGTILCHAVYSALDSIDKAPIPEKLTNVNIVTFTDGLDVGSWRLNPKYTSSALYLQAINERIHRTYIDGMPLSAYSIGIKGNDVSDVARFEHDLQQLASDPENVHNVSNISEVNARFREIAAKIYNTSVSNLLTIKLPAPDPGSLIRFTFDDIDNAQNSLYYIDGTYNYNFEEGCGIMTDLSFWGVRCANDSILRSTPDGIFDIFVINDLTTVLGEHLSISNMRQWTYIPSSNSWQVNSEFDPLSYVTISEDHSSALTMLVLDCSSSLGSDFASIQSSANTFLNILAGNEVVEKPKVSAATYEYGDLQVTLHAEIIQTGNLSVQDKGFCVSEYPNMEDATFYSCGKGEDNFEHLVTNLIEGKTYYCRTYVRNQVGVSYGDITSFVGTVAVLPSVSLLSATVISTNSISCAGTITFDGYAPITECGFCWSANPNPTIDDNYVSVNPSETDFNGNLTNLKSDTTYCVRAYAKNYKGISYSENAIAKFICTMHYIAGEKLAETTNASSSGIHTNAFNVPMVYHDFREGNGILVFDGQIKVIGEDAFRGCMGMTSIIIPDSITSIGLSAFRGCSGLTTLRIPNGITRIERCTFYDCSGMASISLPESITSIGGYAFYNCTSISSITIPNNVSTIEEHAFDECTNMVNISLPNSVASIDGYAFRNCTNLAGVVLPDSVTTIVDGVFYGCSSLASVVFSDSTTYIGYLAFSGCASLSSVDIPKSVTIIKNNAFKDCSSLFSVTLRSKEFVSKDYTYSTTLSTMFGEQVHEYIIPEGTARIGKYAFYKCTSLTTLTIPNSVTKISEYAFSNCSSLNTVVYPSSVTSIGNQAFLGCTGLTSINIPNNIIDVAEGAFAGCSNLLSVELNSDSIVSKTYTSSSHNIKALFGNQVEKYIIGDSVTSIGEYAFAGSNIVSIILSDSVKSIKDHAFYGSTLTTIQMGVGVNYIGRYAFYNCTNLPSITIPDNVLDIGEYAFNCCTNLETLVIGEGITTIGKNVFRSCSKLKNVTLGSNVSNITNYAFAECGIKIMTCLATTPPFCETQAFLGTDTSHAALYVPASSVYTYSHTDPWAYFAIIYAITE